MRVELLTIGSELTSGATLNTNAAFLGRRLSALGLPGVRQTVVGDDWQGVLAVLRDALDRCELLIVTGGLGPTFDDVTMAAIAEVTQRPLTYRAPVAARIRRFYSRRHHRLQTAALRQAYLPQGGTALRNPIGTAPGLWLPHAGGVLVALPGVPREMYGIFEHDVMPRLKRLADAPIVETITLRTVGLVELQIERLLRRLGVPESIQVGLYPNLRAVDIRLTATGSSRRIARRALTRLTRALRRGLGETVYATGETMLEETVGRLLLGRRQTLAVAESCTGGLVSHRLTNVPGSSRYLRGAVVAYHNDLKTGSLGVSAAQLRRFGAVSAPVVRAMANGVRRATGSRLGLSVTGVAGPGGGTSHKPVGLVFFGLADRHGVRSLRCHFVGDRSAIKSQAAQTALDWLRRYLLESRNHSASR